MLGHIKLDDEGEWTDEDVLCPKCGSDWGPGEWIKEETLELECDCGVTLKLEETVVEVAVYRLVIKE